MVREVSKLLMTSDAELVAQAERLVAERDALKQSLVEKERLLLEGEVRQHLAQADQLGGVRLLEMTFSDRSIQQLQQFAHQAVAQAPDVVCLLAATGEKLQLVFARGAEVNVAVNQLIKDTLPIIDGKGGGNAAMAQGGGQPTRPAQEVLDHAKQLLKAALS
jgi:alanyl-tRNA synthetase